jgi:hypothetical protein
VAVPILLIQCNKSDYCELALFFIIYNFFSFPLFSVLSVETGSIDYAEKSGIVTAFISSDCADKYATESTSSYHTFERTDSHDFHWCHAAEPSSLSCLFDSQLNAPNWFCNEIGSNGGSGASQSPNF